MFIIERNIQMYLQSRRRKLAGAFRVITDKFAHYCKLHEDEIAVDRPRVGSSFRIHESFASVGSFATCDGPALGELADKPKGNDL